MVRYNFDLGTTPILITTRKQITQEILDSIFKLIQFVRFDFNHTIHNSSGNRLTNAKVGVPFLVSPEFIHYLNLNKENLTKNFTPFLSKKDNTRANASGDDLFSIQEHTVVKKYDFNFNSQIILQPYILDLIYELLSDKGYKNFLIQTNSYYRADKNGSWKIKYEIEDDIEIPDSIENEASGIIYNTINKKINPISGFANLDTNVTPSYAILKTESCVKCKVRAMDLFDVTTDSGFRMHSKNKQQEFIIIDSDLNKKFYSPNKFLNVSL